MMGTVEGAPKVFATDFFHQYNRHGGCGSVWALVTTDPDGFFSSFFLSFLSPPSLSPPRQHHPYRRWPLLLWLQFFPEGPERTFPSLT